MTTFPSAWHTNALAGQFGPMHDGEPEYGYFRSKDGARVVYWPDSNDGSLRCQMNGKNVADARARELWTWVCRSPVSEDAFYFHESNSRWPDHDAGAQKAKEGSSIDPEDDPIGAAREQIDHIKATLGDYANIDSDTQSGAAQTSRDALLKVCTALDRKRKELVQPHLDAQREINGAYNPVIDEAKQAANILRKAMEAWEDVKREQARQAAAAAAQASAANEEAFPQASNAPAPSQQIKGATGKAASVGNQKVVTITDIDKLFAHFRQNSILIECLQKLAKAQVEMDIDVPGVKVEIKAAVR